MKNTNGESMTYESIHYSIKNSIATITLYRPERLNAWTLRMAEEVRHAMFQAAEDEAVRVIILTGAGRAFCAGADMEELKNVKNEENFILEDSIKLTQPEKEEAKEVRTDFLKQYSYFPAIPKPIIAAINGVAVGIGFVITLFCDIRIASKSAKFSTMFAKRGLIAEHGIGWILPRIIGLPNAIDMLFSARMVGAEEALRMGLVHRVVSDERLIEEATSYGVELITSVSPRSLRIIKKQLYDAQMQTLAEAIDIADREMLLSFESEDFKEGVAHFIEKRPPKFKGK